MKLIAQRPCVFGGRKFYKGQEVPLELVDNIDVQVKRKTLVVSYADSERQVSGSQSGTFFTQEQVDNMIAAAVANAEQEAEDRIAAAVGELKSFNEDVDAVVTIAIEGSSDGQQMAVPATPEEIQQVFSIMQMTAEDGTKAITEVKSENVLILLHAADSRKTVKEAAKKRADTLFDETEHGAEE